MRKVKRFLKQNRVVLFSRLFLFNLREAYSLSKYLGAANLYKTQEKFEAYLTIKYHAIEKGLALPQPRIGFGEKKIDELISLTYEYYSKFGNKLFLKGHLNILDVYFDFQQANNHVNEKLHNRYFKMKEYLAVNNLEKCGIISLSREDVLEAASIDFARFASLRYSIRDFSTKPVDKEIIEKALEIAKKTPSACNRQPWHVYVCNGERKTDLLNWQGGTPGFTASIDTIILLTCDLNGYFIHEKYQAYVDGGLYAMALMFAFHSLGIGSIPLTTAKKIQDLDYLYKKKDIPSNQVPIMIIGIGHLKERFNVAVSARMPIDKYTKFISK